MGLLSIQAAQSDKLQLAFVRASLILANSNLPLITALRL
ncbi:hypothetical protein PTUN_a2905 [Pseudoalteromonas tunicata]|nr:hypothetical protein PTUN_a2905 [Pseudoalteromonas tunicata]